VLNGEEFERPWSAADMDRFRRILSKKEGFELYCLLSIFEQSVPLRAMQVRDLIWAELERRELE